MMDIKKEVTQVMSELKSAGTSRVHCSSSLYGALIMIRTTLIKSKEAQIQLIQAGCIPLLLGLLIPPTVTGNWLKTVDIVISILANMCLEEEVREQVISNQGLSSIVEATKCTEKESIHNRGVRAVANLIQHSPKSDEICEQVFNLEFHIFVARRLMETTEKECKQTYLRAIRLFGQQKSQLFKVIDNTRCVQAVAIVLKEDDVKLKHKSLRILYEFSSLRCCGSFVEQILAANILEELVQSAESSDDELSSLSLHIILKLCENENIRPPLGAAGLISTFMRLLDCDKKHINHISIMNALCLCCFEAVNRHRLHQEKTLELFVSSLNSHLSNDTGKFSVLQDRIISSLVCFLYNDECFDKLLELDLVKVLIGHLKRVCNLQTLNEDLSKEVDLILSEKKNEIKDATSSEFESNSNRNDQSHQIINSSNSIENVESENSEGNVICTPSEMLNASDILDQEIMDISMDDTQVIKPSEIQDSRHTFSINSPTYQMEQHSWRLEDHTSGITCKNYSEDPHQDDIINPKVATESWGGKFSPYSPLSAASSYYSPAYPSPAHSFGSSPKHSNFQTGSFHLGSQSPQSSPSWSPSNSLHSEDTWSSSDQAGRSPNNLSLSPNFHQGQFSPLINPYPASPPPIFSVEDRNICESPLYNSQVSIASNRTLDSQEDIFSESPKPMFPAEPQKSSDKFSLLSETLKVESQQKLIYSSSEEEEEEGGNNPTILDKLCKKTGVEVENEQIQNDEAIGGRSMMSVNNGKGKKKDKNLSHIPSTNRYKSIEIEINDENATSPICYHPTTSVPFVRLNSEPCFSISSTNSNSIDKQELPKKGQQSGENFTPSPHLFSVKGSMKSGKRLISKQFSFPNKVSLASMKNNSLSPKHPSCSSSPYRIQFDLPFNSPYTSPFSRNSNSPYTSPNPYHPHTAEVLHSGGEVLSNTSLTGDNKSSNKILCSTDKTCLSSSLQSLPPPCSTTYQDRSPETHLSGSHSDLDQPSTSKSATDNERLRRIKKKTEENILVLLSRISVKTNPSPYLPKYDILSTLTKYVAVVPIPLQRCLRIIFRVFHNPHCFESVLLEQAPALIVKNLILDQEGKFPSVLFKDQKDEKQHGHETHREINFDEIIASSQSSETPSDFELQIQFEFGGDAYSNMHQRSFHSDLFQPNFSYRSKSLSHCIPGDNSFLYSQMPSEDLTRIRIHKGINLMKVITSLALSRYGDGEIQRLWSRGTESEKLMCAISLLNMPIGCGPLHRHQIIFKHGALQQVIPLLFCKEAPHVRESIVTALSLLAHLFKIKKMTPKISKLLNTCPDLVPNGSNGHGCSSTGVEINENKILAKGLSDENLKETANDISCNFENISNKFNLNLIVEHNEMRVKKVFRACKEILMKKSEVFSAMLGGGYAEADKVDIEFSDVNWAGFEYILHFLHGCESGCAVIDSLSLLDSNVVNDCDKDLNTEDNLVKTENQEINKIESLGLTPSVETMTFAGNSEIANSESGQCKHTLLSESGPSSLNIKKKDSNEFSTKNSPSTSSTSSENSSNVHHMTKKVDNILDKCIDILTVADRFLIQDLIPYLTSVLSHTCLYTRTVTDIIYIASTYKLTGLATDCIVEVLLSQTSQKDIASLFQMLGVELDSDIKEMLIDILISLFEKKP